ncbi:hypothetical protein DXG01_016551 [Tephrocybe rancida]|nr:hypothetical protein DXG01_016551 [Tephrocybe rancida]
MEEAPTGLEPWNIDMDNPLPASGSIFFREGTESFGLESVDADGVFVVGPSVERLFWADERMTLDINRGPDRSILGQFLTSKPRSSTTQPSRTQWDSTARTSGSPSPRQPRGKSRSPRSPTGSTPSRSRCTSPPVYPRILGLRTMRRTFQRPRPSTKRWRAIEQEAEAGAARATYEEMMCVVGYRRLAEAEAYYYFVTMMNDSQTYILTTLAHAASTAWGNILHLHVRLFCVERIWSLQTPCPYHITDKEVEQWQANAKLWEDFDKAASDLYRGAGFADDGGWIYPVFYDDARETDEELKNIFIKAGGRAEDMPFGDRGIAAPDTTKEAVE